MKRKTDIKQSFALLRQLPPEVSFSQVQQWVKQHRLPPPVHRHWLTNWLSRWRSPN